MRYTYALMYGNHEATLEEIGAKLREMGTIPKFLAALQRIEDMPGELTRDKHVEALQREGLAVLRPYAGHPIVAELLQGFGLAPDDLPFLGLSLMRMLELGKREFFQEIQN